MKNDTLSVNEIFVSIDGEGKRAGELAAFIRLTGCNLRCSYCDTRYAFDDGIEMSVAEILQKIGPYKNVTVTGGEPLTQDLHGLIHGLLGRNVNIETNGSVDISPYMAYDHVFFTLDYKCPSSGMEKAMLLANFKALRSKDVLKFVVGTQADLEAALNVCRTVCPASLIYISPVFGAITPAEIVGFMLENNLEEWRLQLQMHKIIWDPNKRGV